MRKRAESPEYIDIMDLDDVSDSFKVEEIIFDQEYDLKIFIEEILLSMKVERYKNVLQQTLTNQTIEDIAQKCKLSYGATRRAIRRNRNYLLLKFYAIKKEEEKLTGAEREFGFRTQTVWDLYYLKRYEKNKGNGTSN